MMSKMSLENVDKQILVEKTIWFIYILISMCNINFMPTVDVDSRHHKTFIFELLLMVS